VELESENIWRQHEAEKESVSQSGVAAAEAASAASAEGAIETPTEEPAAEGVGAAAAPTETLTEEPAAAGAKPEAAENDADAVQPGDQQAGDQQAGTKEDEEALKADYRRIAERRVRLGLLLAEVGRRNNIGVTQDELNQAITREARRHPGYERQVLDFYRQNPEAVTNLRAPIFEDKVIDFIVELAKVEERKISPQDLLTLPDPDAPDPDAPDPDAPDPDAPDPDADGPDANRAPSD
jgi:hypothetical protein